MICQVHVFSHVVRMVYVHVILVSVLQATGAASLGHKYLDLYAR